MGGLQVDQAALLTFFAVLVRFGTIIVVLPFFGDMLIPQPIKILLAVAVSVVLYPILVANGQLQPGESFIWAATAGRLMGTIALEALFGLAVGFTARLIFDAIHIGSEMMGTFMGLSTANQYDPSFGSQTQVVSQFQVAIAMLIFLALNGHHLMLQAAFESYRIVGLGKAEFGAHFADRLVHLSGDMLRIGLQIAAPMAFATFCVNLVYAIFSKALPQMNVLVMYFSISAMIGFFVMLVSMPEFHSMSSWLFSRIGDDMGAMMVALSGH
jgi:flagellar biosynthetic protein FliR